MLSRAESPRPCHSNSYTDGVARQSLDQCLCAALSEVVVSHSRHADEPIKGPSSNRRKQPFEVSQLLRRDEAQVIVKTNNCCGGKENVHHFEELVECMSGNACSLEKDDDEGDDSLRIKISMDVRFRLG